MKLPLAMSVAAALLLGCAQGETPPPPPDAFQGPCGDGVLDPGEMCDDGFTDACGSCNADCSAAGTGSMCGDGVLCEQVETCDDGFADACGSCNTTCTAPGTGATCGDSLVCAELESCDDGFTDACGSCNADCTAVGAGAVCGDGQQCPQLEMCDDGFLDACGTCNATCSGAGTGAVCGDGMLCPESETCDMGLDPCHACATDCKGGGTGPMCGDGDWCATTEQCDDGNGVDDDWCSNSCVSQCGPTPLDISPTAIASSSGGGEMQFGYGPERMNDGHGEAECGSFSFHWVSASFTPAGQWIQYTWPTPVQVARVQIDTQLDTAAICSSSGRNLAGGQVQYWDGSTWVTVGTVASKTDDWGFTFPTVVTTTMIRIFDIYTSNTGQASNPIIFEWDVFSCP